jgi:hypothetical protein
MFILGFILMLSISFGEMFNLKRASLNKDVKNLMTAIFIFSGFVITAGIFVSNFNHNMLHAKELFHDWRLYIGIFAEICGVWLSRKNYEVNGNNITAISFALFLSLVLVPTFSYLFTDLFAFKNSISVKYHSSWEFIAFVSASLILVITFFIDKIKTKINSLFLLSLLPIILSTSMFFTSKMMQIYEGVLYYGIVGFSLCLFFLVMAIKNKEQHNLKREHLKDGLIISGVSVIILPMNLLVIKFLAVEFITLLKRVSQIINGIILDKIHKNDNKLKIKDKIVVVLICILGFSLYYFRG